MILKILFYYLTNNVRKIQHVDNQIQLWTIKNKMNSVIRLKHLFSLNKARAARDIIELISSTPPIAKSSWELKNQNPDQTKDQCLNKTILEMIERKYKDDIEVLKLFQEMFNERKGVKLPIYLQQQKIIIGKQKNGLFPFFPNRIVSPLIFNVIRHTQMKTLIYGQTGISKTASFVFYCYLSKIISDYDIGQDPSCQQFQDIPRLFYLSYNNHTSSVLKLINRQIPQNLRLNQPSQQTLKKIVRKLIQKRKGFVVFDQFNNFFKDMIDQKNPDKKNIGTIWMDTVLNLFKNKIIYSSQHDVGDELRKQKYKKKWNIDHHQRAIRVDIELSQSSMDKLKNQIIIEKAVEIEKGLYQYRSFRQKNLDKFIQILSQSYRRRHLLEWFFKIKLSLILKLAKFQIKVKGTTLKYDPIFIGHFTEFAKPYHLFDEKNEQQNRLAKLSFDERFPIKNRFSFPKTLSGQQVNIKTQIDVLYVQQSDKEKYNIISFGITISNSNHSFVKILQYDDKTFKDSTFEEKLQIFNQERKPLSKPQIAKLIIERQLDCDKEKKINHWRHIILGNTQLQDVYKSNCGRFSIEYFDVKQFRLEQYNLKGKDDRMIQICWERLIKLAGN